MKWISAAAAALATLLFSTGCTPAPKSWADTDPALAECTGKVIYAKGWNWEAGPREAIQFPDGLVICITDVSLKQSPTESEGELTVVTLRFENAGSEPISPGTGDGAVIDQKATTNRLHLQLKTGRVLPKETYQPGEASMVRIAFDLAEASWPDSQLSIDIFTPPPESQLKGSATFLALS